MIIKGISLKELNESLKELNNFYDNNIKLNNHRVLNKNGTRHRLTLRVKDCNGYGSRHGFCENKNGEYRRTNSVCFHGHGDFFEMLFKRNDKCEIRSMNSLITVEYGNWINRNVGSSMYPILFSDMCEC